MAKVSFCGLMVLPTKVNGLPIRCMARESSGGLTVEFIKDNTETIRNMVMAFTLGQMVKNTRDDLNSMEKAFLKKLMEP